MLIKTMIGSGEIMDYPKRGDIYWVTLDPTVGSETQKTRPCLIISNNAQNKKSLRVIIAPVTSKLKKVYPFEAKVAVNGREGKAMLDQIKAVDKQRLGKRICVIDVETMIEIETALKIALALI
jgi:mRNA interferase MazF